MRSPYTAHSLILLADSELATWEMPESKYVKYEVVTHRTLFSIILFSMIEWLLALVPFMVHVIYGCRSGHPVSLYSVFEVDVPGAQSRSQPVITQKRKISSSVLKKWADDEFQSLVSTRDSRFLAAKVDSHAGNWYPEAITQTHTQRTRHLLKVLVMNVFFLNLVLYLRRLRICESHFDTR